MQTIEGIVERYAPGLVGHGDHSISVLLKNGMTIFNFPSVRQTYAPVHGRSTESNCYLVELTAVGDEVVFEIKSEKPKLAKFENVAPRTFRNLTLEGRLGHKPDQIEMKDITPNPPELATSDRRLLSQTIIDV